MPRGKLIWWQSSLPALYANSSNTAEIFNINIGHGGDVIFVGVTVPGEFWEGRGDNMNMDEFIV